MILKAQMKRLNCGPALKDPIIQRLCFCNLFPAAGLLCLLFIIGSTFVNFDYKEKVSTLGSVNLAQVSQSSICKSRCNPSGSEPLPKGIIRQTSDLEMHPLWGPVNTPQKKDETKPGKSLLAIPVGIKQKEVVNKIVEKFPISDFIVILFHYDGIVDEWRDLQWSDTAIHISAINQTKWWFAKRFLHPDIVSEYDYIFLWDEDLGVEHFHSGSYLSIVRREGFEISQPAVDTANHKAHHQITVHSRRREVHRRIYRSTGGTKCDENSTAPPCTGWVEMMAPVFSRAAWRCAWHMIQNDLIHAWGLDMKLGYCAQGDRTINVGVVDSEYIIHKGIPTLGGSHENETNAETPAHVSQTKTSNLGKAVPARPPAVDIRLAVRARSYAEQRIFGKRWRRAAAEDKCWTDPYPESAKKMRRRR